MSHKNKGKGIKGFVVDKKKRAEKKKEYIAERVENPLNNFFIAGTQATINVSSNFHSRQHNSPSL